MFSMALKNSLFIHTKFTALRVHKQYAIISFCFENATENKEKEN